MWNILNCFFKINFDNVYTLMSVLELASVVKEYFLTKERSSTLFIFYGLSVLLVLAFSSSIAPDYWTVHFQDVPYRSDRFILVFPACFTCTLASHWEFQWNYMKCKFNIWYQLHIFYLLNFSQNNNGTCITCPRKCLSVN